MNENTIKTNNLLFISGIVGFLIYYLVNVDIKIIAVFMAITIVVSLIMSKNNIMKMSFYTGYTAISSKLLSIINTKLNGEKISVLLIIGIIVSFIILGFVCSEIAKNKIGFGIIITVGIIMYIASIIMIAVNSDALSKEITNYKAILNIEIWFMVMYNISVLLVYIGAKELGSIESLFTFYAFSSAILLVVTIIVAICVLTESGDIFEGIFSGVEIPSNVGGQKDKADVLENVVGIAENGLETVELATGKKNKNHITMGRNKKNTYFKIHK